jgi:hypothetical protein
VIPGYAAECEECGHELARGDQEICRACQRRIEQAEARYQATKTEANGD